MKTVIVQAQQKWDYCFENRKTENSLTVALNELGQQGWELVSVSHHKDLKGEQCWTAFLKRPSVGQNAAATKTAAATTTNGGSSLPTAAKLPDFESKGFDLSENEFKLKEE